MSSASTANAVLVGIKTTGGVQGRITAGGVGGRYK